MGEIVLDVQFRVPTDRLRPADVTHEAEQLEAALVSAGLTPHSLSGYAASAEDPSRSLGFQLVKLLGEMR